MIPFFKNINISRQKNRLFHRKSLRCLTDFTEISEFFHKIIVKISIFMEGAYKSRENSNKFSYLDKFLAKKLKKTQIEDYWKWYENV